jgi:hypothetical protein
MLFDDEPTKPLGHEGRNSEAAPIIDAKITRPLQR